jgi:hypothetical protein
MMYIEQPTAKIFKRLGFERSNRQVMPYDCLYFYEQNWIAGGTLLPEKSILAPRKIVEEGSWEPGIHDLLHWLEERGYTYTATHEYKVSYHFMINNDRSYKQYVVQGFDFFIALQNAVEYLLQYDFRQVSRSRTYYTTALYLDKQKSDDLLKKGFKKVYGKKFEYDNFFAYENEIWVLGGRMFPEGPLLAPKQIYEHGSWLIDLSTLIEWLDKNYIFAIKYAENGYQIKVINEGQKEYLSKEGFCLTNVLYEFIARLLIEDKPTQEYDLEIYDIIP